MEKIPADLRLIVEHVKEWPEEAMGVRFDADGEICFFPEMKYDFYVTPRGQYDVSRGDEHPDFIPAGGPYHATGKLYSKEQWEEAHAALRMLSR